jgi:hypothetical protein
LTKGYIYLLECVSKYKTTYKIGYTRNKNIKKRIKNLQTGNKDKIKCIDSFESKYGRKVETSLHNLYSFKREGGEWFDLDINDIVKFQNTCKKIEENFDILDEYKNPFI